MPAEIVESVTEIDENEYEYPGESIDSNDLSKSLSIPRVPHGKSSSSQEGGGLVGKGDNEHDMFFRPYGSSQGGPYEVERSESEILRKPSELIQDMTMSTQTRLKKAFNSTRIPVIVELLGGEEMSHHPSCTVPMDQPLFEPFPKEIIIQGYSPFKVYEVMVSFRNNDQFARRMQVEPIHNPFFSIHEHRSKGKKPSTGKKVAPGMQVSYVLSFRPEEQVDYKYNLVCMTEREKFLVPIRAIGSRALLDFPDEISFPESAVRYQTTKVILVRNIGSRRAVFNIQVDLPFSVEPCQGMLETNESRQFKILFSPEKVGGYDVQMTLSYDTGEAVYVRLLGTAEDANIRLERNSIRLDNTYITKTAIKTFKIINRSDIIAHFKWKEFSTSTEERHFKQRRVFELEEDERIEIAQFKSSILNSVHTMNDLSVIRRKFMNKRREIEENDLFYNSNLFMLSPLEGDVWPNSFVEMTVVFKPETVGSHIKLGFCQVSGRETRLPVQFKAEGVGPKARFSYDLLDIEDVFVHSTHVYEVLLENLGDIDAEFQANPHSSMFGKKFTFRPAQSVLKVGNCIRIEIEFNSDLLGEFYEEFQWTLQGGADPLVLAVKGKVVGPTFHFDQPQLNFGKLSYGFLSEREVVLHNSSEIPMVFRLKIVASEESDQKEMTVEPSFGKIKQMQSQVIKVGFTPQKTKQYHLQLAVDVISVGEDLMFLPIYAHSMVPVVQLKTATLDYGECFLNYSYKKFVDIVNKSDFYGRYELQIQEESAKGVYAYHSQEASGTIPSQSCVVIPIIVEIKRLGQVNFPIFIKLVGGDDTSHVVDISAVGIGPNVNLSSTEVNFGKVNVLSEVSTSITLTNESPISAQFTSFTISDHSVFSVEPTSGIILPKNTAELTIKAFLDDCLKFGDILRIGIKSGNVQDVTLHARGFGSTITFPESLRTVAFGDLFSNRPCSQTFVLTNKGRRNQYVQWMSEDKRHSSSKGPGEKENEVTLFSVTPNRFLLKPGTQQEIHIKGFSTKAQKVREVLVCQTSIEKDPSRKSIVETLITANFINPLIEVQPEFLNFYSIHQKDDDFEILSRTLVITNTSSLPLTMLFKCPPPYKLCLPNNEKVLQTNETLKMDVLFDPSDCSDRISCKQQSKLLISYAEHPQKDSVDLISEVLFPNITLSTRSIEFGCIPSHTEVKRRFVMTNSSSLPVQYTWYFLSNSHLYVGGDDKSPLFIEHAFDILPIRGTIAPNSSLTSEVVFYGHENRKMRVTALCDVVGGPKYELQISGEGSLIQYEFDRTCLDFGVQSYQEIHEQDLTLSNVGKVLFDYSTVIQPTSPLAEYIAVSPAYGSISPGGKQKITLKFCPCGPETIRSEIFIQIASFEPVRIEVSGCGTFPRISFSLPRLHDEIYTQFMNVIETSEEKSKKKCTLLQDILGEDHKSVREITSPLKMNPWELDFRVLERKTRDFLVKLSGDIKAKYQPQPKQRAIGSTVILYKSMQVTRVKAQPSSILELSQVVLCKYLCDFGNVVRNTSRKKMINVTNRGTFPVTFHVDKIVLGGTGFTIEPERVKHLPGEPHCESVELQITFQTRALDLGPTEVELPVHILGGPTIIINLKAYVTLPELVISSDSIDFGDVLCGQRKTITIQFYNPNVVPCEWSTAFGEIGSSARKKKNQIQEFEVVPSSSIIPPGEKMNVMMRFSPSEQKDYNEEFPVRLALNSKIFPLKLQGKGVKLSILFEPESITLPPILPHSDGADAKLMIFNPTNFPLEIYSTDFDPQYLEEESIIRKLNWNDENAIFIPPRLPGDPLPDYIIESAMAKNEFENGNGDIRGGTAPDNTNLMSDAVGDLILDSPTKRSSPRKVTPDDMSSSDSNINVVIMGPPFCGKTTHAKKLALHSNLKYFRIDEVIDEALGNRDNLYGELSNELKEALQQFNDRKGKEGGGAVNHHHIISPEQDGIPLAVTLEDPENEHSIPFALLSDVLNVKIHSKECKAGIVVDGLDCKYFPEPPKLLRAILQSIGDKKKCIVIHLALEGIHVRQRELHLNKMTEEKQSETLRALKEVTEEEYDELTDSEKKRYHQVLLAFKKKLKDMQLRRLNERRVWETEVTTKSSEKKTDEERDRKKKDKSQRKAGKQGNEKAEKHTGGPKTTKGASTSIEKTKESMSRKSEKVDKDKERDKEKEKERDKEKEKDKEKDKEKEKEKDKDKEKAEDFNKKTERVEARSQDETGSHQELNEAMELLLGEQTFKMYELFNSTLEGVLNVVKEYEKGPTLPPPVSTPEKKDEKYKKSKMVSSTTHPGSESGANGQLGALGDSEAFNDDAIQLTFHDIPASQDLNSVFSSLLSLLPSVPVVTEQNQKNEVLLPEPFIEQIIFYPQMRETQTTTPPNFTLLAKVNEEDAPAIPAQEVVRTNSITGLNVQSKTEPQGKKSRHVVKQPTVEEVKPVEVEEEPERDTHSKFRWVLQPKEKREFTVRFTSTDIGKFEKGLNFEITGSKGKYTFKCTGNCEYAQIVKDYKKVFPKWRKSKEDQLIIHGEYIANTGFFEYGPLLYSKPREKYLEKFPENRVTLKIINPTPQLVRVQFTLHHDIRGDCFFLEPSSMELKYNQSMDLNVWAYPRSPALFEDTLVCCVKDNPEPYLFKLSCIGVKPELEIDKKTFSFDKLLLHRVETREIKLKNNLYMPVGWKMVGVDSLGEEFKIAPVDGVLEPFKECVVVAKFCGTKPLVVKRIIRMEVFDIDKIGGIVQSETILIQAEAYDVSMEVHCPKGSDGTLDFGVLKVYEEAKQVCVIKNKGKYEVGYKFVFENKEIAEHFSISPLQGVIQPSDKPFPIQVIFRSTREIQLKDFACLKCLTVEPSTGEVIDSTPIKLTTRAVFSKYAILPVRDLNFGALVYGSKGVRQFYIDNIGEFDFRFSVYKIIQGTNDNKVNSVKRTNTRQAKGGKAASPPPAKINKKELVKQADAANFGPFVVYPTSGVVMASTRQSITVEFHPEHPGSYEEVVALDITDRSPVELEVIEYRLLGESCVPGINNTDFNSIFEEHTVCKRLDLFSTQSQVFSEEEKVFYFGAYLVGHQAQARFKISNPFKVPCDVSVSCKPRNKSLRGESLDLAFDVEPKKLIIPSHEYSYVAVTFHPTLMQSYSGILEAVVEGVNDPKYKMITFELRGEGTLPRINIEKPTMRGKSGLLTLKFKRMLLGTSQVLPIVLKNDGIIDAKVKLDWNSSCAGQFECSGLIGFLKVKPQEIRNIDIKCTMHEAKLIEGELKLSIADNRFEDTNIQLIGEGFLEDLTMEGLKEDQFNCIAMGDCFVEETKQFMFSVRNHSSDAMRVSWTSVDNFEFSPSILHLRAKSTRDITVTFQPQMRVLTANEKSICKYVKIKYVGTPPDEDWDDRALQVKWVEDSDVAAPKKVLEQYPEPSYEIIPNSAAEQPLTLTAFSNYSNYQCDISTILFKSTLMFQTRVFRFQIRNTGKVKLRYELELNMEGSTSGEEPPFFIDPREGTIDVGESSTISVKFSPLEVGDYSAYIQCYIPNLSKECKQLVIQVSGSSLRPLCHFELEESDYLTSERRNMELGNNSSLLAVTDPATRVIEFFSCGIKVKNTRRFYIVNPTNWQYEFEWTCANIDKASQCFNCLAPKGTIMSGKKFDAVFEYVPEDLDLQESLWTFNIREHGISVPFLLVGRAKEPVVYIDRASITFKPLLVGHQMRETVTLINNEATPFSFIFNETSFDLGKDQMPVLKFSPTQGTIGPHSEVPIEIIFRPSAEKNFNFNLVCNVRKKPSPVNINVKGEGYTIHEAIQGELGDGQVYELASGTNYDNVIDFGQVQIKEKRIKRLVIVNSGKFTFEYSWKMLTKNEGLITFTPEFGTVHKGERVVCEVSYLPVAETQLKNAKAICKITNGRSYYLTCMGSGARPLLNFSTYNHDFGTHFLWKPGNSPLQCTVVASNDDSKDIFFDLISSRPDIFDVQRGPFTLQPQEKTEFVISFYPKDAQRFTETIQVEVNGLSNIPIAVQGEGTMFKIQLQNNETGNIHFGALRVGHTATRVFKLINRSAIPATFSLGPPSNIENLFNNNVYISLQGEKTLPAKGMTGIEISFKPKTRLPPFTEEIFFEGHGFTKPLFIISGACQGVEVKLENDTLPFGAVVQKSSVMRRLQIQNNGDVGVKFAWDVQKYATDVTISPNEGYISPGMDISLEITIHPQQLSQDIRYENISCNIEGSTPLLLTLTGMCIPPPLQNDIVKFSTPVRSFESKTITLSNKSSVGWHIRPVIDNEYWSGPEYIDIEVGQTKHYEITFTPLEMNGEGEGGRHEGSVFFPLPDGSGLLYKLSGQADKPLAAGNISRDIPSKTAYTEVLPVKNWLKRHQRFRILMEVMRPDPSVFLKGADYIDVPGLISRDYKINFYAYKEGITNAKIIFKNEQTQEYLFYNVTFKSIPPGVIGTVDMCTPVRQLVTKEIVISNPTATHVTFTTNCAVPEITVPHSLVILPKSQMPCVIEFLPVVPKDMVARLSLTSPELGLYQYDLKLSATPAGMERALHFKVGLGGSQIQTLHFVSYSKVKTEYVCKIDHPDFTTDKTISAPSCSNNQGIELAVDILYEPSKLGDTRTHLVISSPIGGDYMCPLYGHCAPPRPQGPIYIRSASPASVSFKNVFFSPVTFQFTIDNPAFSVKANETIGPKKTITMNIGYRQLAAGIPPVSSTSGANSNSKQSSSSKVGKLTITNPTGISWIFYLKGGNN